MVVDADKVKMEVISEILNGLIRNYFEAVSLNITRHSSQNDRFSLSYKQYRLLQNIALV